MDKIEVIFHTNNNIESEDVKEIIQFIASKNMAYQSIKVLNRLPDAKEKEKCCDDEKKEITWDEVEYQPSNLNNSIIVDKNTYKKRKEICSKCKFLTYNFCKRCRCFMPAKAWLKKAICKEKKW